MELLTLQDFTGALGHEFDVDVAVPVKFRLIAAEPIPTDYREGGGFRLEWSGPLQPALSQGLVGLTWGDRRHEIFIVPIARDADGMRYEAVFN